MKRTSLFLILALSFTVTPVQAGWLSDLIGPIKTYLNFITGQSDESSIELPVLPKKQSATRAAIGYEQKVKNEVTYKSKDAESYNYSFIVELFSVVRQKKPENNEINKWMNVLSQSGSREGIYRALVLDRVYLGLENYSNPTNSTVIDFSLEYMATYLGQTIERDKMEALNFYTIKRSLVEKSLEIVDLLFVRPSDDVYDWYAVLSSDLAERYPDVWKNEVRKNTSAEYHKNWAKNVPDQYLKSEVMLKLHRLFNHLQS